MAGQGDSPGAHGAPPAPSRIIATVRGLSTVSGVVAAAMIVAAVVITCQMIWVRAVQGESTIWQTDAVIYLMIGATLLGLPYVQLLRGHVNVDLLPLWLGPRLRMALAVLTLLAALGIIAVMVFYSVEMWHMAWTRGWRSDTVWGARLWIPYLAMPVGFTLYWLQLAADLYGVMRREARPFDIAG